MWNPEGIKHPLTPKEKSFVFRKNPFTNKWEWWQIHEDWWSVVSFGPSLDKDFEISYEDTWAEPTKEALSE